MADLQVQLAPHPSYPYRPPSPMSVDRSSADSQQTLVDTFVPALGYQPVPRIAQFVPVPVAVPDPTWRGHCCDALVSMSDILCTCFAWCCGVLCIELC